MQRITYCPDSWRKELARQGQGRLFELKVRNPAEWNPPEDTEFDTVGAKVHDREYFATHESIGPSREDPTWTNASRSDHG